MIATVDTLTRSRSAYIIFSVVDNDMNAFLCSMVDNHAFAVHTTGFSFQKKYELCGED